MKQIITMLAVAATLTAMSVAAGAAGKGEQIFSQKCAMCHKVQGKGGSIGPELTKIASHMKQTEIVSQLENPKKRNPSTSMPSFKSLSKADLAALLDYLKTLK